MCPQWADWRRRCALLCPICCSTRGRSLWRKTWRITERRWDTMASPERSVPAADGLDYMSRCLRATCVNNTPLKGPCNRDDRCRLWCVFSVFSWISWMDLPLLVGSADVLEFAFLLFRFQPKFCCIGGVSEAISSPQSWDFRTETLRATENELLHSSTA